MLNKENILTLPKDTKVTCYFREGQWDASDVLSAALLKLLSEKYKFTIAILRSNNIGGISFDKPNMISCGIGGGPYTFKSTKIYRDSDNKYPYGTFGLLVREFGSLLCENYGNQLEKFDEEFVKIIDWSGLQKSYDDTLSYIMVALKPAWIDTRSLRKSESVNRLNNAFFTALDFAISLLKNKFKQIDSTSKVYKILDGIYNEALKKDNNIRHIVLSEPLPWLDWAEDHPNIRYYIYETQRGGWIVQINPLYTYRVKEVEKITGVVFSHYTGSLVVCKNLDEAIALTKKVEEGYMYDKKPKDEK